MADDNTKIYDFWRDSSQRFDYFVTGFVAAVVAYVANTFVPERLGLNAGTLELLSLLVFLLSLWFAFKRLETGVVSFGAMYAKYRAENELIRMREMENSPNPVWKIQSGEFASREELSHRIEAYRNEFEKSDKAFQEGQKKLIWQYRARNYLMILGFLLLIVARVLRGYLSCALTSGSTQP